MSHLMLRSCLINTVAFLAERVRSTAFDLILLNWFQALLRRLADVSKPMGALRGGPWSSFLDYELRGRCRI